MKVEKINIDDNNLKLLEYEAIRSCAQRKKSVSNTRRWKCTRDNLLER